jgi:hypothetical protein
MAFPTMALIGKHHCEPKPKCPPPAHHDCDDWGAKPRGHQCRPAHEEHDKRRGPHCH